MFSMGLRLRPAKSQMFMRYLTGLRVGEGVGEGKDQVLQTLPLSSGRNKIGTSTFQSHSCLLASVRKPTARLRQLRQGHASLQRKNVRKPCLQGFLPLPHCNAPTVRAKAISPVAHFCALSLIIARCSGIPQGIVLPRELTRWHSPLN
jgi:hypothetical protein